MAEDIIRLERRVVALEQKISTEQAMRVALLTDITARLDMLEHKTGEAPPADPATEVPLTREEAEQIARTCAEAAAARPDAPPVLTTVNLRGWRPQPWVVDAVLDGAFRSRVGQARTEGALAELRSDHERDQQATALRIAKVIGVYCDDDDDEYELDVLLGMLEAKMAELRRDASRACDAQRVAMGKRDELRDQRDAMRSERDQALDRVRELEEWLAKRLQHRSEPEIDALIAERDSLREQVTQLERARALASTDTVQAMESAAGAAARVQELERDNQALRERHDQLFAGAQQAYQDREAEHQRLAGLLQVIGCETFEGAVLRVRETNDHMLYLQGEMLEIMEECDNSSDSAKDVISTIHDLKTENAKLKSESLADVMAKLEQLRGQVTNMHADQMWLKRCEEMEMQLGGALGISSHDVPSWHAMLQRVRELCKRTSGGVAHE